MKRQLNQRGFHIYFIPLIIVLLGAVGFTGWYVWDAQKDKETGAAVTDNAAITPTPTPTPTTTPTPALDVTAGWSTYTNTQYHFSLKYPTDWAYGGTSGDAQYPYFTKGGNNELTVHVENYSYTLENRRIAIEADGKSIDTISFDDLVRNYNKQSEGVETSNEIINSGLGNVYFRSYTFNWFGRTILQYNGCLKDDRQQFYGLFFKDDATPDEISTYKLVIASLQPIN